MDEQIETPSKAEMLDRIRSERTLLEELLTRMVREQMTQVGVEGDWSVKDILAHISTWERCMVGWIEEALRNEIPEIPKTWEEVHQINARIYTENKDNPLDEVLEEFGLSHQAAWGVVESTPEECLVDPQRFDWRNGVSLWKVVAANTWWHYAMHRESIEKWLEGLN
ncbi:MAG: ClbS/DfsB family four-helix bundle protein [Chloroflexota bacterium]